MKDPESCAETDETDGDQELQKHYINLPKHVIEEPKV